MKPTSRPQPWIETTQHWHLRDPKDATMTLTTALHQVKRTSQPSYGHLCQPFEAAELVPPSYAARILVEWRFFNPFGPSRNALFEAAVPDSHERLLIQRTPPPQVSSTRVWGWLPSADPKDMRPVVAALFRANGSPERPLMHELPTHVELRGPFSAEDVKEFFWAATQATRTCSLTRTCDYMEWFKNNPFERVAAELRDALDGRRAAAPATRTEFERWWSLATDAHHIAIENRGIEETLRAQPEAIANFLREALRSRPEVF
jgi:hypothetical protein